MIIKVVSDAKPLRESEILAQRDDINRRLEAIKADLSREKRQAYKVQQESRNEPQMSAENKEALEQIQKDHNASTRNLLDVAREASQTPALQTLAEKAMRVADEELKNTQQDFNEAR